MFSYIKWEILSIDGINITILVDGTGLGLEVLASPNLLIKSKISEKIEIFIHHHITDVSEVLFGFCSKDEKNLFKNLIKVNWIGGKTALNMLGLGEETLAIAIREEDDKLLSTIPGIGKKTAQKIIVDLKGSIDFSSKETEEVKTKKPTPNSVIFTSLVNMWYDKNRVEEVIANIDSSLAIEEQVRIAIKNLAR